MGTEVLSIRTKGLSTLTARGRTPPQLWGHRSWLVPAQPFPSPPAKKPGTENAAEAQFLLPQPCLCCPDPGHHQVKSQ